MSKPWHPRVVARGRAPHKRRGRRFRRVSETWLVAIGLSAGLGCAALATMPDRAGVSISEAARPADVRVIDGDTFDYAGERIRIADIDTPEIEGRCPAESALAARAAARTRTLLADGPFELRSLAYGRDEDQYGRKLRIVTRGGRSLGDKLVAEGLARTWTGRREPWC